MKQQKQIGGNHYASRYQAYQYAKNHAFNPDQFNILKYAVRFPKKEGLQDLKKSVWYDNDALREPYANIATFDKSDAEYFIKENGITWFDWTFLYELSAGDYSAVRTQLERIIEKEYGQPT